MYAGDDLVGYSFLFGCLGPGARSNEKWVVHNIGSGPEWEDKLFDYEIAGHFRFAPLRQPMTASTDNKAGAPLSTSP